MTVGGRSPDWEVALVAYAQIRPVHVADLLTREGHPLARRVLAARAARDTEEAEEREFDGRSAARRTLGVAAGAMIVMGSVVAGVLGGLNGDGPSPSASGEPVGALPSTSTPVPPAPQPAGEPAVDDSLTPKFTNASDTGTTPSSAIGSGGGSEIGAPAAVTPPARVVPPPRTAPEQPAPAPAPEWPAEDDDDAGLVESATAPVTETVESTGTVGQTINDVVAPVTETVDDTLQPALSLIGGLLSR